MAFVPAIVFVGIFLAVIPAVVLACTPNLFLITTAFLVHALLGCADRRKEAWILIAVCVFALAGVARYFNEPASRAVTALSHGDHDSLDKPAGTLNLGIQTVVRHNVHPARLLPDAPLPRPRPTKRDHSPYCEGLCLHLLFNGQVKSIVVSSVDAYALDPVPDDRANATRFRVERRDKCPPTSEQVRLSEHRTHRDDALFPLLAGGDAQSDMYALNRIAGGECLISERASLSDADVIIQEEVFEFAGPETIGHGWPLAESLCFPEVQSARRISVYKTRAGIPEERFRRTQIETVTLPPLLLTWPVVGSSSENWPYATVRCMRWDHEYSPYDLKQILKTSLGVEIEPIK